MSCAERCLQNLQISSRSSCFFAHTRYLTWRTCHCIAEERGGRQEPGCQPGDQRRAAGPAGCRPGVTSESLWSSLCRSRLGACT